MSRTIPRLFCLIVVMATIGVAFGNALARAEGGSCALVPDTNTSQLEPQFAPPKFTITPDACCSYCQETPSCVAAVHYDLFCYLFNSTAAYGGLVPTRGAMFMHNAPPTTTTTTTTTAAPTTTTTTTTTSTAAPTTTPVPTTTTPAPTNAATVTVVREVQCQYSSSCNRMSDYTCQTAVYFNNSCDRSIVRLCTGREIQFDYYANDGCNGSVVSHSSEPENVCKMTNDDTYVGHYCDVAPWPATNVSVERRLCPLGCDDGSGCSKWSFTTGVCTPHNALGSILPSGRSVMAWCFPNYVVYLSYPSSDCSGQIASSAAEPVGQQCFLDYNEDHIQNLCRS